MKSKRIITVVLAVFFFVLNYGCTHKKEACSFVNKKGWKITMTSYKDHATYEGYEEGTVVSIDDGKYLFEIKDHWSDNYLRDSYDKFTILNKKGEKLFEIKGNDINSLRGSNHVSAINGIGLNIRDENLSDKLEALLAETYEEFFEQKAGKSFLALNYNFDENRFVEALESILQSQEKHIFIRELPAFACTLVAGNLKMIHADEVVIYDANIKTLAQFEEKYRVSARVKAEESLISKFDSLTNESKLLLIRIEKIRVLSSGFDLDGKLEKITTNEKNSASTSEQAGLFSEAESKSIKSEKSYSFLTKVSYKVVLEVEYSVWKKK